MLALLILIVIIKQNKYTSLAIQLLGPSNIIWVITCIATIVHNLTRFTIQSTNGACITILILLTSGLQSANFIEMEPVVLIMSYSFYCCYKLYSVLSEQATQSILETDGSGIYNYDYFYHHQSADYDIPGSSVCETWWTL